MLRRAPECLSTWWLCVSTEAGFLRPCSKRLWFHAARLLGPVLLRHSQEGCPGPQAGRCLSHRPDLPFLCAVTAMGSVGKHWLCLGVPGVAGPDSHREGPWERRLPGRGGQVFSLAKVSLSGKSVSSILVCSGRSVAGLQSCPPGFSWLCGPWGSHSSLRRPQTAHVLEGAHTGSDCPAQVLTFSPRDVTIPPESL